MTEPTDVLRLYLDDDQEPFKTARPPLRFQFSTLHLADGAHRLRIEAHNGLAGASVREIPFLVRNGVAITCSGIVPNQEIAGQVGLVINAYAGNTEVDFEPSRAETPQPIPTWAWLIFLAIVAWTMFYVLNPQTKPVQAATAGVSSMVGERVYVDVCGKCHGDDGLGAPGLGPARLQDAQMVISPDPTDLVAWVTAGPVPEDPISASGSVGSGRPRMRMLAFGPPRLAPMELVAALNYARTHWGNQAPTIDPVVRRAPAAIREFDEQYVAALQRGHGDLVRLQDMYAREEGRVPRLVRRGLDRVEVDVSSPESIRDTLQAWLSNLREVNSVDLRQAAYAEMEGGRVVYAHGKVTLTVTPRDGSAARAYDGHFVRVYVKELAGLDAAGQPICDPEGHPRSVWRLAFDYATTPMGVGCPPGREGEVCPAVDDGRITYADVQRILASANQRATHAPHGNFWELPYAEFVALTFPYKPVPGATIRMVNLDPTHGVTGAETNLVKALRDGRELFAEVAGQPPVRVDIERMPKGAAPLASADIGRIISWLDHGHPEGGKPRDAGGTPPAVPPGPGPATPPGPANPPGPPTAPAAGDLGFDDVVAILSGLNPKASSAPHGEFWKLPYEKFVALEFPIFSESAKARLVEPGKPDRSNFLRAFRKQPLLIVREDGTEAEYDMGKPMPPKGKGDRPTAEQLAALERWVAAGCPKVRGGGAAPGGTPPAPPATPPAAPPATPPSSPPPPPPPSAPPPPPPPAAAPTGDTAGALDFAGVVAMFEGLAPKAGSAPHGEFWKLPYEKFVALEFPIYAENGKARLVEPGKPERSNILRALEKKPLLVTREDGVEIEYDMGKPMPPKGKGAKPTAAQIEALRAWIAAGCPKTK
ncbi:MAG: hypothetical protein IT460_06455 [Planctomycetes bacterium]|nr:hypothetical protein [Planctomycetota bacterium]